MAPPSGSATYKKKDGTLTMSQDSQSVSWIPAAGGASGTITLPVGHVTNLQQTPASNPKVMLKIFVQSPDVSAPEQYVFSFTAGANARPEADAIKDALSSAIQATKAAPQPSGSTPTPTPTPGGTPAALPRDGSMSAAMAMANAVSAGTGRNAWDDDNRLKADAELQQSLLRADPNLKRMFFESLDTKPESLTTGQFASQFWSTRLHLLRAHAIERGQLRGSYNVLSTLKPRTEENVTKLNISKEQIQLIFSQHPLVKRVYDECVPKLSEQQFWSRFFQSRLFKKLRGERVSENDATDGVLDKYLLEDENVGLRDAHVPQFLNLAGNEVNHSQRRGNRPDLDMRPSGVDKVPIIRTLNSLSEKIMAGVAPADRDPTAPVGMDEETYNALQLRDLQGDEEQGRVLLNVRDQSRFFTQAKDAAEEQSHLISQQDPEKVLGTLRTQVQQQLPDDGTAQLGRLVQPDEDEDADETRSRQQVGSKSNLQQASTQILGAIRDRRTQTESSSTEGTYGLTPPLYDRLILTHATSTEFLHQFWQAFLSGNADRAGEVASLVESLNRAMQRIKAVAADAEADRQKEVERLKQHARDMLEATGRKIRVSLAGVVGGEKVVNQLLGPTIRALEIALGKYKEAFAEELKEAPA
ncbi:TFIIH subunit TFB1 family protein [Aspergillus ruber CBS 135680]|uniref:Putative RNA polymerase II transcription factor-related protein n=1 Tax=Aspergillus ruber (strain CBS 135680) TaxID=1388766 RepID=A0A017S7R8_ASPRC|nr:putative RNA polymerase II transcription factor-related protein [Aspergillus ruber CBS 135680]EYE92659.1 putative RNA polymerase II transcription factor-related protein [Aspergillus ruber CBS 135680]